MASPTMFAKIRARQDSGMMETGVAANSLRFIGTATVLISYGSLTILADPNSCMPVTMRIWVMGCEPGV